MADFTATVKVVIAARDEEEAAERAWRVAQEAEGIDQVRSASVERID